LEALGLQIGDPIIGLIITLVILRIIWQSFITVQRDLLRVDQPLDRTRSCWRLGSSANSRSSTARVRSASA
jgi:hypothetical protein